MSDDKRNIPEQIRKAEAEANRLLDEQANPQPAPTKVDPPAADESTPVAIPAVPSGEPKGRTDAGDTQLPEAGKPQQTPEERIAELERELTKSRAAYESFQGRFVGPISEENRVLRKKLEELEKRFDEQKPKVAAFKRHLKPDEIASADETSIELTARIARGEAEEVAEGREAQLMQRLKELEERVKQSVESVQHGATRQARTIFWNDVETKHPGFCALNDNADKRWVEFLAKENPITGEPFRKACTSAIDAGDATRFARIVAEFKREYKITSPTLSKVQSQAQPDTVSGPDGTTLTQPKTFTQSFVDNFYKDLTTGRLGKRMSDENIQKLQSQIEKAIDEGQVIDG